MLKLEKPISKIGFTLFVVGFLSCICSVVWWSADGAYRDYWSYTFNMSRSANYGWQSMGRFGALAMALGVYLALAYDSTVGRWLKWVGKRP